VRQRIGERADAERAYQNALAYNPHVAAARHHLAALLHRLGRTDEARR
jgi:Flp pilus assembly protein TadD